MGDKTHKNERNDCRVIEREGRKLTEGKRRRGKGKEGVEVLSNEEEEEVRKV